MHAGRNILSRAIDGHDQSVDSLIVIAFVALVGLIVLSGWDVMMLRHEFSAVGYGGAVGAILAGLGGSKAVRDRFSPQGDPPRLPDKEPPRKPDNDQPERVCP